MFDPLKAFITKENLSKLKEGNKRYNEVEQSEQSLRQSEQGSWDDYEFEERQANYSKMMNEESEEGKKEEDDGFRIHKRDYLTPQCKTTKLEHELQLANERIRLTNENALRQLKIVTEKYEMEVSSLRLELEVSKMTLKKYSKETQLIANLRRENIQLVELKEDAEGRLNGKIAEIKGLEKTNSRLEAILLEKEREESEKELLKRVDKGTENAWRLKLEALQSERILQKKQKKDLETKLASLREENRQLKDQIATLQKQLAQQIQTLNQHGKKQFQGVLVRIQEENNQLRTRNTFLEDSLIEHLTHTSTLLFQAQQVNQRNQNTTLNLNEESPIVHRKKAHSHFRVMDPEKIERNTCGTCVQNGHKVTQLKEKLVMANSKIVELLRQKCLKARN